MDDLKAVWDAGKSLVVYHQLNMSGKAEAQIRNICAEIHKALCTEPIPMWFHRGTSRVFLVIPQECHRERITARLCWMLASPWGERGHFTRPQRSGNTDAEAKEAT
ncbi:MAG: hypothetical protein OXI54_03840 [Chloroflexota bacterium]|nr:hypothetical protein [Chloroflexota bacterium]MDE2683263.1 hypothetical protein [Chloroflexota bacterium]